MAKNSSPDSVRERILAHIKRRGRRQFVFPADLVSYARPELIKDKLAKLAKDGTLLRLGYGIYYYPKVDKELGPLFPSLQDVAAAIAKRDNIIITPTEATALNVLGLSAQVPINAVFLSSGRTKIIKVDVHTITFKSISANRAAAGGRKIGLVIRAFEGIGQGNIKEQDKLKLLAQLDTLDTKAILRVAKKVPRWIADVFREYVNSRHDQMVEDL